MCVKGSSVGRHELKHADSPAWGLCGGGEGVQTQLGGAPEGTPPAPGLLNKDGALLPNGIRSQLSQHQL